MKHSAMLRGITHETRVGVIASATVIRIFVPFVTVFPERLGAASFRITSANATAISGMKVNCFYGEGVEVVGLQIVERGMIVVKLENSRGRKKKTVYNKKYIQKYKSINKYK